MQSAQNDTAKGGEGRLRENKRGRVKGMGRAGLTGSADADLHSIRPPSIGSSSPPTDLAKSSTESCARPLDLCVGTCLLTSMLEREARPWSPLPPHRRGRQRCAHGANHLFVTFAQMEREHHAIQICHATPPHRSGLLALTLERQARLWSSSPPC
jgi:hypothetical protein